MKKYIFIIILNILFLNLLAQRTISGTVVDSKTKEPIPYAMVSVKGNEIGIYSDDKGFFKLEKVNNEDSILISHLSYINQTYMATSLKQNCNIKLEGKNFELKEIIVLENKYPIFALGNLNIKANSSFQMRQGSEAVTLINSPNETNAYIKELVYKIPKKRKSNILIRAHLYENNNGKPGNEIILKNNKIVIDNRIKADIVINLKDLNLKFPKEGLFMGFEFLGTIDVSGNLIGSHDVLYGPTVSTFLDKNFSNSKCKINNNNSFTKRWNGEWKNGHLYALIFIMGINVEIRN